jgi:hypothetical protein
MKWEVDFAEPNDGNGFEHEKYSWTQTLQEVTVQIKIPEGTKSRMVACDIKSKTLKAGLKGQPPILAVSFLKKALDAMIFLFVYRHANTFGLLLVSSLCAGSKGM